MLVIFAAAPATAGKFLTSIEAAKKEAQKKNQLIFVDMYAEWCGWCHRFDREVVPSEAFQKATANKILLRVDTEDRGEGSRLARDYGVQSLPTFLLLAPDMTLAGAIRGYAPAAPFAVELERLEGEYEAFRKRIAGESKAVKTNEERLQIAKELYMRYAFGEAESRLRKLVLQKKLSAAVRDETYYYLARAQAGQFRLDEAVATLQKFFKLQDKGFMAEQGRFFLGQIYVDQKNYRAALDEFKRFRDKYPGSPLIQNVEYVIPQLENAVARAQ
jgi:thioredoxin-related protein